MSPLSRRKSRGLERWDGHRGVGNLNASACMQRAIELAFFGGYTHLEIANMLGDPLGTIKSRIRIGMQRLKQLLLAQGIEAE